MRKLVHMLHPFSCAVKCGFKIAKLYQKLIPLGFEPRTSRVLGERDNHYTMESLDLFKWYIAKE